MGMGVTTASNSGTTVLGVAFQELRITESLPRFTFLTLIIIVAGQILPAFSQCMRLAEAVPPERAGLSPPSNFTITKQVDEVNLLFSITDSIGRPIPNVSLQDFRLLDKQQATEKIRYFQRESSLPLRVALLIDTSASITTRFKLEKKAASVFLRKVLRPGVDLALLIAFDEEVRLVHDFTDDVSVLDKSINTLQLGDTTALYDAIVAASDKLHKTAEPYITRRVIILITDGQNTKERTALLSDAQDAAIRADTILFALNTESSGPPGHYTRGEAVLDLLTHATGGMVLGASGPADLKEAFKKMEKLLRNQYALGYTPPAFIADGSFHTIEIVPRRRKLKVHCRRGYYALPTHQ
jgi:Ca-activated chloride channel homolog